jgi:hypothetical protein
MNTKLLSKTILLSLCTVFCLLGPTPEAKAATKVTNWSGSWNNKKYGTKGPLKLALTSGSKTWQCNFTGTGLGKPFRYSATLTPKKAGNRITLTGVTTVDGDRYNWTGYVQGSRIICSYKAASGNNGSFSLTAGR